MKRIMEIPDNWKKERAGFQKGDKDATLGMNIQKWYSKFITKLEADIAKALEIPKSK